ncbi:MFS transporter [Leptolyngbya sp. 'hensonii']|uniref:MFS transporter n=1 Tax=Leptolyngbya sp. 'hensonii' TaxID=1922337 RepID=UPI00094F92F0|nr:MFS transporter [Leptolyngbya sp. 'hensonii']OLP18990.1 MFS transporter [Leptolyngbya sp. 'hensonii']
MDETKPRSGVLWLQVFALATVQGAITLAWVIYGVYLVKLLTDFGLPDHLGRGLLIIENALAVVMEPLMGGLSDRGQRWLGTRFPFISVGVILSSALFIAIPTIVLLGRPTDGMRWVLILIIVAWSLAMTVFRSPALCLLGQYAFATKLPQAASILTLVGGLAGAIRPLASGFLLSLGPALTFAIGSFTLLGSAAVLRAVRPQTAISPAGTDPSAEKNTWVTSVSLLFGIGFCVAWGVRLALGEILPRLLQMGLPTFNVGFLMGMVSILLALFSVPAGTIATRQGNRPMMALGAVGVAGLIGALAFLPPSGVLVSLVTLCLLACLSLVLNGAIPLALSMTPASQGGLAIGMYFGGFSAAISLFGYLFAQSNQIALSSCGFMAMVAFVLAAAGILWGDRQADAT